MGLASADAEDSRVFFGPSTTCSFSCPTLSFPNMKYENGYVYVFDYLSEVNFLGMIYNNDTNVPKIGITSRAHITVVSQCEMILSVSEVKSTAGSSPYAEVYEQFSEDLQRNPLRFSGLDGKISYLCPAKDEPLWALNYKRAILSVFQSSMTDISENEADVEEEDVNGKCYSNYQSVLNGPDTYNITRTRNASSCQAPSYAQEKNWISNLLQQLPILYREQKCEQTVANGKLKEATCRENIRFSFSDVEEPAVVEVFNSLNHVREFKSDFVVVPTYQAYRDDLPIQYENRYSDDPPINWLQMALDLVENLSGFRPTPENFYQLTELLKLFKYDQLTDLFIKMPTKNWENALMSVIQVGTSSSLSFLKDYFKSSDISTHGLEPSIRQFIKKSELSEELLDLQNFNTYSRQSYLLRDFCEANDYACYDSPTPAILKKLESTIEPFEYVYCPNKPSETITTNSTQKIREYNNTMENSFLNLQKMAKHRYFNKSMLSNITDCILQKDNVDVRLSALEVLSNGDCSMYNGTELFDVLKQGQFDSDYERIMVYILLAKCPASGFQEYIEAKLEGPITQETSFIWTSVNREQDNPFKSNPDFKKYVDGPLKFSRTFVNNFEVLDKEFVGDVSVVFDEQQLVPKYAEMSLYANKNYFDVIPLIQVEMHEQYGWRSQDPRMHVIVKVRSRTIYDEIINIDKPDIDAMSILFTVFISGFSVAEIFSSKILEALVSEESPLIFLRKDINLFYPSSAGFPFQIQVNKTWGTYQQDENLEQYYNARFDACLMIDATHTNIGTNMHWKWEDIPTFNATVDEQSVTFDVEYPEIMNTIFSSKIGFNNIENGVLTPRFRDANEEIVTKCLDSMQDIFGATYCFEWTPCPDSMAFSKLHHKVYAKRSTGVTGEKLVFYDNDVAGGIYYEVIGRPDAKYDIKLSKIGAFKSFQVEFPYFKFNGTGIAIEDQKINITGYYNYHRDARPVPYYVIGNVTTDPITNNSIFIAELECRDYHAEMIMVKEIAGDNSDDFNCSITLPYKNIREGDATQYISMGMQSIETERKGATGESKSFVSIYMNATEFPSFGVNADGYFAVDQHATRDDTWKVGASASASCADYELNCAIDGSWGETAKVVSYSNLTGPGLVISVNKTFEAQDTNYKVTKSMSKNGETCYDLEINAGMTPTAVMYGNLTFEIPVVNQSDPLFKMQTSARYNPILNKFSLMCDKQISNESMHLNITVGPVVAGDDMNAFMLFSMQDQKQYQASIIGYNDEGSEMSIVANSKLSGQPQDIDLSVEMKTPFSRWYEPGMKLSLNKVGSKVRGNMKTTDRDGEYTKMEFDALSDYDIMTNLIDTYRK